jgi:membrane protein
MLVPIIILIALLPILSVSFNIIFKSFPGSDLLEHGGTFVLAVILLMLTYRILPSVKLPWKELLGGAVITALLLLLGKALIGSYLSYADIGNGFGGAGSLVAILAWIYYSAQVFFLSASYMYVYSKKYGHLSQK